MNTSPNILFITDDQHRWDWLEMTRRYPVRTPHLARLASEGIWYRQTYSTCPLCMPARASLHSGLYAHQTGLDRNIGHWPFGIPMLPNVLRGLGYRTAAIGKLHVFEAVPERLDLLTVSDTIRHELGYDDLFEVSGKALAWHVDCEWTHELRRRGLLDLYREKSPRGQRACQPFDLSPDLYQDVFIGDRAVQWLQEVGTEKPFFLWAGLVSPHPPFDAPAEALARQADHAPSPIAPGNIDEDLWQERRRHYSAMVEIVDTQVGRLLQVLDERGLAGNTLVIFAADHGEMLEDRGLAGKCFPFDPSVRVPCLMRWPGHTPAGVATDALIELIDLPATCLEAASGSGMVADFLPGSTGRSLVEHWKDPAAPVRTHVFSEDGGQFCPAYTMIADGRWKYVLYPKNGEEALYDVLSDPGELTNRIADPSAKEIRDRLKTALLLHYSHNPAPHRLHAEYGDKPRKEDRCGART